MSTSRRGAGSKSFVRLFFIPIKILASAEIGPAGASRLISLNGWPYKILAMKPQIMKVDPLGIHA